MSDTDPGFQSAKTLSEALPFIQRYHRQTVVIKFGGHAMVDAELSRSFARDVVLLKQLGVNPVVVHGGGPQIGKMLEQLGIKSAFEDGQRVTDDKTLSVVEMVLAGSINTEIVRSINMAGGKAVGLSGADANLLKAKKLQRTVRDPDSAIERVVDLGFVGEPETVTPDVIQTLANASEGFIPVIAPLGVGSNYESFNINADTAAGAIAEALKAKRLLLMTDVTGVLDKQGQLMRSITASQVPELVADGTAKGGMIPKLETASSAVDNGVEAAVILDGRKPNALLVELFTDHGAGTLISDPDRS
ncbi:MAG: acetylglutamate kinase [Hyphomonadaceae bacterium TMED5]|nr:MAG: acetylglutamate kinase [Hyphomonadaceae bacterium TMED5]|tara:strand:- start:24286 stop:25194 length:909 start_codon:yes stop_codon:yes gene_type:complete